MNNVTGSTSGLANYEIVLMILGIVLFVLLAVALVVMIVQKRKFMTLLPFFVFPILMIGFHAITSWTISGGGFEASVNEIKSGTVQVNQPNAPPDAKPNLENLLTKFKAPTPALANSVTKDDAKVIAEGFKAVDDKQNELKWEQLAK